MGSEPTTRMEENRSNVTLSHGTIPGTVGVTGDAQSSVKLRDIIRHERGYVCIH